MIGKSAMARWQRGATALGIVGGAACLVFFDADGSLNRAAAAKDQPAARIVTLLSSGQTVMGETIAYPADAAAKVTALILTLQPGESTGWHKHPVPAFGYVLEGEVTVDYGVKGQRVYKAGDGVLEAMDVAHEGVNSGTGVMRILAVFMGSEGKAVSEKAEPAGSGSNQAEPQ